MCARKWKKQTWISYVTQPQSRFGPCVPCYPGLSSSGLRFKTLITIPESPVSGYHPGDPQKFRTRKCFDESSLGGCFSSLLPPFDFPCQLENICLSLTSLPTPHTPTVQLQYHLLVLQTQGWHGENIVEVKAWAW